MTALRICFVGDSITNGRLDDEYLGWPGRLCRAERARGHDLTLYNLGVRRDTSRDIERRWEAECAARLPVEFVSALVFSFGVNDTAEDGGIARVSIEESLAAARRMLTRAAAWRPVLWIGPSTGDPEPGSAWNRRIATYSAHYEKLAGELRTPYLDLFSVLIRDPDWLAAQRAGDGVHPTGPGYAIIAAAVAGWPAWRRWLED